MSYPSINGDNFYKQINKKYDAYKIPTKKKTFDQICFPKKFELQLPQQFLSKYVHPNTPYKSVLVFHRIGAGKTCAAVSIAEQWKKQRKIIVVTPASLIGNFRTELRSQCAGDSYLKEKEREQLKTLHPSSDEYKRIIALSDKRINAYYQIYSYNKFVEFAQNGVLSLRNSVLIIDEIQNMVSESGTYYDVLKRTLDKAPRDLRIVLLSATPIFDKPLEIALTLNLLRLPVEIPTGKQFEKMFIKATRNTRTGDVTYHAQNMDIFKERIKGFISYFRGAPPYTFPESIIKYVKCEMSNYQYRSYLTVQRKEQREIDKTKIRKAYIKGQIDKLPNNFFIGSRIISNIAFPEGKIKERGYMALEGKYLKLENLKNYSIKFYKIMKKIGRSLGPVIVYSNFKEYGGIKSFVKVLESQGYKDYIDYGEGRKRFAVLSGDVKLDMKEEIKAVYNQTKNTNGSRLKVLCITSAIKEGYSFKAVRQMHILEPYWNQARLDQIIGRGVRYCSHKELSEEERFVEVFIYIATHPNEKETVDQYIRKLAFYKNQLIEQFNTALKEAAVDCELFKQANVYTGEPPIKCER